MSAMTRAIGLAMPKAKPEPTPGPTPLDELEALRDRVFGSAEPARSSGVLFNYAMYELRAAGHRAAFAAIVMHWPESHVFDILDDWTGDNWWLDA